jgi:hypothetical protein
MNILQPTETSFNMGGGSRAIHVFAGAGFGIPEGACAVTFPVVSLVYGPCVHELHCCRYRDEEGRLVTVLPQYKLPGYKFHLHVYLHALCLLLIDGLGLRQASKATREDLKLGAGDFSHTTLMRFMNRLDATLEANPAAGWMASLPWQAEIPVPEPPDPGVPEGASIRGRLSAQVGRLGWLGEPGRGLVRDAGRFRAECETLAVNFYRKYRRFLL